VETWDAITARRNVRQFTTQPIPPEHLDRRPFDDVVHRERW
jgi:hypothetical protein